jgi:hypothetical protein
MRLSKYSLVYNPTMKKPLTFYTIILLFLVSLIHSLTGCDSSLREKNYFTIGSTKDDVLRIQGQPDRFSEYTWYYGRASVGFSISGSVKKWTDSDGILNAQLELSEKYEGTKKNYFTIGSTKDDVLRIQGQPDRFSGYTWYYGRKKMTKKKKTSSNASVAFGIDGRVKKWTDSDGILNAQLELSERKYE